MTNIYLVRHCETPGNAKGIFQGALDLDISELGARQLEALSSRFADIEPDVIVASPLTRTRRTAAAIRGDRDIPIIIDPDIIEINCGVYEGRFFEEIVKADPHFSEMWSQRPWEFDPPNGEKMTSAYDRIWRAVNKIAREHEGKTVVLASHGAVIRLLLCRILRGDITLLNDIPYGFNTAVSLLEFDGEMNVNAVFYNDDSHLGEALRNPAAEVPK